MVDKKYPWLCLQEHFIGSNIMQLDLKEKQFTPDKSVRSL